MPYGHPQIHETRHGNMTQTEFTGEDNEFEYAGYDELKITTKYDFLSFS